MKAIKLILRCLIAAFMGSVAALCMLTLVCMAMDLLAWLQGPPPMPEGEAPGRSGDSTFGNSAAILLLIYGPFVALGGLLLFSMPMYYLFFTHGWPRKRPLVWLTALCAALIQFFYFYITGSFGFVIAYASFTYGLTFACLVLLARDGNAKAQVREQP